jgi:hypothetical protein
MAKDPTPPAGRHGQLLGTPWKSACGRGEFAGHTRIEPALRVRVR